MIRRISAVFANRAHYIYAYLILVLLHSLLYFKPYTEPILTVFLAWGAALIAWDLFQNRAFLQTIPSKLACLLIAAMGISALCSGKSALIPNIKVLAYNCVPLLLLFPFDKKQSDKIHLLLKKVSCIYVAFTFFVTLISDFLFLFWVEYSITVNDAVRAQGIEMDRLVGIYDNPVDGSIFAVISILLCLYLWQDQSRWKHFRKFAVVNMFFQGIYIIASDSTGPVIALAGTAACAFLFFHSPKLHQKLKIVSLTCVVSLIICVLYLPATLCVFSAAKKGLSLLPYSIKYIESQLSPTEPEDPPTSEAPSGTPSAPEIETQIGKTFDEYYQSGELGSITDVTTGRLYIWKASFACYKQHPILGIGGKLVVSNGEVLNQLDQDAIDPAYVARLIRMNGSTHNIFIQVLLVYGLLGLVCFIALGIGIVIPVVKKLPSLYKYPTAYKKFCFLALTCVFILLSNMAENYILCRQAHIEMYLFWLLTGAVVSLSYCENTQDASALT